MAGARGQPERQIAGRRSDRQCNYAEPLGKAAEGRPRLASAMHGLPTLSGRPQFPQCPQIPQTQVGDSREEEESWGEGRGGGPWLIGVRLSCLLGKTPPGLKMGV